MSSITDCKKCKQCGYEFGVFDLDCRTGEWEFDCLRCGYRKSQQWITAGDGTRIGWKHEILDGYGAVWATPRACGVSTSLGLHSAQEVEEEARKMRTAIADGELDARSSYVTRWNPELKRAELAAGTWCQHGEVFDVLPLDEPTFPVEMLSPEDEGEAIGEEGPNV